MAVTNNIREIREQRGIYQDDLAAAIGFSTKTVGRIERGDSTPSAEFMLRISKYFNLIGERCLPCRRLSWVDATQLFLCLNRQPSIRLCFHLQTHFFIQCNVILNEKSFDIITKVILFSSYMCI